MFSIPCPNKVSFNRDFDFVAGSGDRVSEPRTTQHRSRDRLFSRQHSAAPEPRVRGEGQHHGDRLVR